MNCDMTPYYQSEGITIYHADCRDILPALSGLDTIVTDPVWPNPLPSLTGAGDPYALFADAARLFPAVAQRLVVQLGCDSDPRFLCGVPAELPFFRTCWLRYSLPSHKGRVLYTSDVAYVFGAPPPCRHSERTLPGEFNFRADSSPAGRRSRLEERHPCPRRLSHVTWLVNWFARGTVLDPFMGSGTTLLAARHCGLPAVGIEIEERYCEVAAKRLTDQPILIA